jgi:hypothetical protein
MTIEDLTTFTETGKIAGAGSLAIDAGTTTVNGSAAVTVANWTVSGDGTDLVVGKTLSYKGAFSASSGATLTLSGGDLTLTGANSFAGATLDGGSYTLTDSAAATVSALTIGGTTTLRDSGTLTESGGSTTLGDAAGDVAKLAIASTGTWDIQDDSGIARGSSTASAITNHGILEKTGGTDASVITPKVTNDGTVLVSSGTLDLTGAVTGKGTDTISGASTLEFGAGVSTAATLGEQDIGFTGGGTLHLLAPASFYGEVSDFAAHDTIKLLGSWAFHGISHAGDVTTLTLAKGSTTHAFEFVGDYSESEFHITPGTTTTITYA